MQRYKLLGESIKDRNNISRYSTVHYPYIPDRDSDIYTYSKRSDRLDLLAYRYYGDQTLWWVIARANDLGKGTFNVPPGIRLRIPFPVNELIIEQTIRSEKL